MTSPEPSKVDQLIDMSEHGMSDMEMWFNKLRDHVENMRKMSLSQAAADYVRIKNFVDEYEEIGKIIAEVRDLLKTDVLPKMFERDQMTSFNTSTGYRVTTTVSTRASMVDKLNGMQWLRENNLGSIVTETVNASTLSSVAKTLLEEGKELDPLYFNVFLQPSTSVTKIAKKGKD